MKQFFAFIQKEFYHVFRDRKTLLMLFGLPIVQIVLFGFALSNEIKNTRIGILDASKDESTRQIISRISASPYFEVYRNLESPLQAEEIFKENIAKLIVVFPVDFGKDLLHLHKAQVQIIADASDPNTATTLTSYLTSIIMEYQHELNGTNQLQYQISPEIRMLYNPELKAAPNFVPGVMALVLMLIGVMMTAVSIVREKELGTMEILLVSPFVPLMVVLSKAVPYLLISVVNVIIILGLSVWVLDLPVNGSILLLFAESMLLIVTALSLGLLISANTSSQQTAMLISLMGMMLPTMLFSGFMFPIENMPVPLQYISHLVPAKWYYIIVKSIMIKGLGFTMIWKETLILAGMSIVMMLISLKKFKIRLE